MLEASQPRHGVENDAGMPRKSLEYRTITVAVAPGWYRPPLTMSETTATPDAALLYGRKNQKGLNVITTVAMTAIHVGAVAAFFFIDAGAILAASVSTSLPACSASACATTGC